MNAAPARIALAGAVTFATHGEARARLADALARGDVVVDWSAVDAVDSCAVSLILYSRRSAAASGRRVRHEHLPGSLDALATLYGVGDLLADG